MPPTRTLLEDQARDALGVAAFDASPWPSLVFDADGRLLMANEAAELLFGQALAALSRRPFISLLTPGCELAALFDQARREGGVARQADVEVALLGAPTLEAEVAFCALPEDRLLGTFYVESQGAKLERASEALRSVAGMGRTLAHEIKNPLAGIRGAAQLLKLGASPADVPLAQVIVDETDRIRRLVDQVEAFSDERAPDKRPVNIHRVLDRVRTLLSSAFGEVAFFDSYDPSLPQAMGDEDQLIQVFINLAKNAAEAALERGDGRGEVLISTGYRSGARGARRPSGLAQRASRGARAGQRPGRGRRPAPSPFRRLRHHQDRRHGAGPDPGAQAGRRPRRPDRAGVRARTHRLPHPAARRACLRPRWEFPNLSANQKVLIADDDTSIRLVLSQAFTRAGFQVRATGSAATLLKWVSDGEGDLVITDVVMPDENAFDVLPRLRKMRPQLPTIVMSAQNTLLTAVNAAQIGAFDYVPKPFDLDEMVGVARRALARPAESVRARAQARALRDEGLPLIGRSAPMQEVYRTLARLVDTSLNVLVTGEVGVGKGLTARALHDLGGKRDAPFVTAHLGGLSAERVDQELLGFGPDRPGKLVEADGGALFLDEIGDLSLEGQARLLRAVDPVERPLHPSTGRRMEMRVLAASRHDLRGLARQGRFREDLLLRLSVATLRLPPLRERRLDDVGDLARAFLFRAHRDGASVKTLDEGALQRLQRHSWPGNVRELENLMRRLAVLYTEDLITERLIERELHDEPALVVTLEPAQTVEDLVEQTLAAQFTGPGGELPASGLYDRTLESLERPLIRMTLKATRGNQIKAAEVLGINRNTLRKKIEVLGIDVSRRRS